MSKINTFLEKGNNKLIAKIVVAVIIGVLSIFTLYYAVNMIGVKTDGKYVKDVLSYGTGLLVFGIADFIIILFTKPLFGFTSFIDNMNARRTLKQREKASKAKIEAEAKAALAQAREARRQAAAKAENK